MIIKKVYKGTTPFVKGYKGTTVIFEEGGGGLPSEYQQVEWIKSTSNNQYDNYINTGFIPSAYTTVTAILKVGTDFYDYGRLFGADDNGFCILNYGAYNNWHMRIAGSEFSYTNIQPDTIYEVSLGWDSEHSPNGRFMLNGDVIETYGWAGYSFTHPLLIFSSWADRDGAYTLYSFKVEDNGVLVRDYVPCYVKATGEVGLYDLVTQQFYQNLGSVPFTCYPAPQSTYTRIEYIESTGTQWIDTGIQPTLTSAMKFGINMSENCGDTIIGNCFAPYQDYSDWRIFNYGSSILWDCVQDRYWGGTFNAGIDYEFECGNNYCIQDGNTQYSGTTQSGTIDTFHILVFAQNGYFDNSLHPDYVNNMAYSAGKLYYLQIYDGGVLVRDFIPVRDGQIGGLYDRVSGQFFGNDGTGNFILGGDV